MYAPGLEGIFVAETEISRVDGERGELIIAGRRLDDLAGAVSVAELCALLWGGDPENVAAELGAGRAAASQSLHRLGAALDAADAMDGLRGAVAQLDAATSAAEITGAMVVYTAAWWRRHAGLEPVAADPDLDHAADLARMICGHSVSLAEARALATYMVAVADHGMNASTFAARVVTSTRSDRVSAVCAAVGALKGPLHGGAPGPVLDTLDAAASNDGIDAHVRAELAAGRRIMGMGHRVYRVRDPRAAVLERAAAQLSAATGRPDRLAAARELERAARAALAERHPERSLCANVELYTAVLLDALGIDRALFPAVFACGRVIGWCAHIDEERRRGRLIRPRSRYIGPEPDGAAAASR